MKELNKYKLRQALEFLREARNLLPVNTNGETELQALLRRAVQNIDYVLERAV